MSTYAYEIRRNTYPTGNGVAVNYLWEVRRCEDGGAVVADGEAGTRDDAEAEARGAIRELRDADRAHKEARE